MNRIIFTTFVFFGWIYFLNAQQIDDELFRARQHFENREWALSMTAYQQVLAKPRSAAERSEAQFRIGIAATENKDYEIADESLRQFIADFSHDSLIPDALLFLAKTYIGTEEYDKSNQLLSQIATDFPLFSQLPETYYLIGVSFIRWGRIEQAENSFRQIIASYADTRFALASEVYLELIGETQQRKKFKKLLQECNSLLIYQQESENSDELFLHDDKLVTETAQ